MGRKWQSATCSKAAATYIGSYLWGGCPSTGKTEAIISPVLGMDIMKLHLQQISDATEAGRYAVVRMDNASWHGGTVANDIENLSIIHLPAYSPELNPVEQVWQWLR